MSTLHILVEGQEQPVALKLEQADRNHAGTFVLHACDETTEFELDDLGNGSGRLRIHGRIIPFHAAWKENQIHLWVAGQVYRFEKVEQVARRATAAGGAGDALEQILAPMPGTILRVDVQAGDTFEAHAPLVIMESMKMETSLSVPHAGRVLDVLCEAGEMVDMGAVLVKVAGVDDEDA